MGALVQLDGSPCDWLEDRGPAMTLLGAIDDATATVLALHFRPTEDLHGYTTLLHQLGTQYGLPLALYGDRLNILVRNDAHWSLEEELQGAQHPTHFGRMLQELGIGYVAAGSPQAKGRIERLWRTLQDRLVSELRLRGTSTREAANAFLPEFLADFNGRFAHAPADATPVWRRPPRNFPELLSCRYERVVLRDNTVRVGGPLDPDFLRVTGPRLCWLPGRGPRMPRWPPRGPPRGRAAGHTACSRTRLYPQAPERSQRRARSAPPRLQERVKGRGALSQYGWKSPLLGSPRAGGARLRSPSPSCARPPLAPSLLAPGAQALPRTGVTFSCCS